MEVFIVRPFGKKFIAKRDKNTQKIIEEVEFDFDRVENELIAPALKNLNITGGTTGEIFEPGDIREEMFSLLLIADMVIADITTYNANVFYELGIRHALRDKKTILIKCPGFDETPFDIVGYRYVSYQKDDPSAAVPLLIKALEEARLSDRKDSPVFNLLPKLVPQDPEKLMAVPADFTEEAEIASRSKQTGILSLMADEAEDFQWKIPAIRLIGEKLFEMKAYENGRIIWEKIVKLYPDDVEANELLATIYQRLAEKEIASCPEEGEELLAQSELAIDKVLKNISLTNNDKRAEAFALKGRNEKMRWLQAWRKLPESEWSKNALESGFLFKAYESYRNAYNEDLNHFYSGINALGLLTVITELARDHPDIWEWLYDTEEQAAQKLMEFQEDIQNLSKTVKFSIEVKKSRLKETGKTDLWLNITEADYYCLTCKKPEKAALMYKKALSAVNPLYWEATIRQLKIYEQLNIVPENIKAVLAALPEIQPVEREKPMHYLLFTGHMIDKPDRKEPRFPPDKEKIVRQKMKEEIENIRLITNGKLLGIAGGACGGDILFHEICDESGIPSELYLALPRDQFLVESVEFAKEKWIDRFDKLYTEKPVHNLFLSKDLPDWLQKKKNYTIWERNNLWELHCALVEGGINMTLLALWDGKGGDGPGGTADMVKEAKTRGAKTIIINP
jgi:hypothetical protein